MVGEAAVESDLGEWAGGADDEVAGFLDAEVTEVFLGRHVEAGFEFTEEAAEGNVGRFGEFGDGDVFAVAFVEELERAAEFFVHAERGGALVERSGDTDEAADLSLLIVEWFFSGIRPVDEAVSARDKFDAVHDGLAGFKDAQVILADVLHDVLGDVVVVPLSENFGGR